MLLVENVSKSYGSHEVLRSISLTVTDGETVALVGPNGAGKSTLLRAIAGLLTFEEGTITIDEALPGSIEARRSISYVGDNPVLYDDLSVIEHLEYVARMHDYEDWEPRANQLIDLLGLEARRDDLPVTFSRGLRQKTALAIGLVRPLDILIVADARVPIRDHPWTRRRRGQRLGRRAQPESLRPDQILALMQICSYLASQDCRHK